MKKDIHPNYHFITVKQTDGSMYQSRSTWGKEGDTMTLEIDPIVHPAWHADMKTQVLEKGQLNKFQNRFGGISAASALSKKKAEDKKEDESAA